MTETDEELLAMMIGEATRILPYADELRRRGYEVSFFISENWSTKKHDARVSAKKELKLDSGSPER